MQYDNDVSKTGYVMQIDLEICGDNSEYMYLPSQFSYFFDAAIFSTLVIYIIDILLYFL